MDAKSFLGSISAKLERQISNPARALLADLADTRSSLLDHANNCTACKTPKAKARKAYVHAQNHVLDVMMGATEIQTTEARMALSGEAKLMDNGTPLVAARAACATAQNTMILLRLMTARIHDADPDLTAFDDLAAMLEPLADAIDAHRTKARGGLN